MPTLRDVGLAFFLGGVLILLGYGAVKMMVAKTPVLIRLGFFAILIGIVILLITFIQEQYKEEDEDVNRKH